MPTVAFQTLGCKVNFYDTEGIWRTFQAAGYEQVPFESQADVYIVNTCTVTNTGDKKSRQAIRRAVRSNPDAIVVATGCYAQVAPAEVAAIAGVDLVVGNDRKSQIVTLVEQVQREQQPYQAVGNILKSRDFEEFDVPCFSDRTRANLKIQDGCNNFCTFCIIPYARGLIRSRKPESIVAQARKLTAAGYREIILTGIHTGGYGADLSGYRLAQLLMDLQELGDAVRIRIGSIEASEIDDALIHVLGRAANVCRHLHIPLQAGHNETLRRMNRHYTVEAFADKLHRLRAALPEVSITSDVIVGFPGETEAHFNATEQFIRAQNFAQLHVFPYSPRTGTPAAKFPDPVDDASKAERVRRLLALSVHCTASYAGLWNERVLEVIPEGPLDWAQEGAALTEGRPKASGLWLVGHADNYLRVAFVVPPGVATEDLVGEVVNVRLTETTGQLQFGRLAGQRTHRDADTRARSAAPTDTGGVA